VQATQLGVSVIADRPAPPFVRLVWSEGTSPTKAIARGAEGTRRGVAEFGGDRQRGEVVDPPETQ
jgi:hypothetical protein